jgi:hypothetical protein
LPQRWLWQIRSNDRNGDAVEQAPQASQGLFELKNQQPVNLLEGSRLLDVGSN